VSTSSGKKLNKTALQAIGVALLALLTAGVVAFALIPAAPPEPTIDIAAVEARASQKAADKAAKAAAELEATKVPLTFPEGRPLKVLMSGDSLAVGWHASVEANSFRVKTLEALQKRGPIDFVPSYWAGAKVGDMMTQKAPKPGLNLDLAILEIGTNDYVKLTDVALFRTQYAAYLDALKASSPDVRFLCMGAWSAAQGKVQEYDNVMKEECESREGKFMDLRSIAGYQPYRSVPGTLGWAGATDSGHPNDEGHAVITTEILNRLSKTLA